MIAALQEKFNERFEVEAKEQQKLRELVEGLEKQLRHKDVVHAEKESQLRIKEDQLSSERRKFESEKEIFQSKVDFEISRLEVQIFLQILSS